MSIVNKVKIKNSDGTYTTADIGASAANIQMSDGNSLQTDYNTLNTGKAPTNHGTSTQSTAATYGLASSSVYGHMKVGTGLSASDGTVSVSYGTSASTACVGNDSRLSNARTPVAHASSETTYGVGTDSAYGHVMVTNNFVRTNQSGYALSAYGANKLANSIASIIDKNIGDKPDSQIAAGTFFYTKDNILRKAAVDISTTTALSTTNAPAASKITSQISDLVKGYQYTGRHEVIYEIDGQTTIGTLLKRFSNTINNYLTTLPDNTIAKLEAIVAIVTCNSISGPIWYNNSTDFNIITFRVNGTGTATSIYYYKINSTDTLYTFTTISNGIYPTVVNQTSIILESSQGPFRAIFSEYKK